MEIYMYEELFESIRKEKGITQKQAAAELGISQALLSHYENGIREPGLGFVCKACDYYGVSADYILGRCETRTEASTLSATAENLMEQMEQLINRARFELNNHSIEEDLT